MWDDLPFQEGLHCLKNKEGTVQVRYIIRGIDQAEIHAVANKLLHAQIPQKFL